MNKKLQIKATCEEGVCPVCGGSLTYNGCKEDDDNGCTYPWVCDKCGATGKESYTLAFDGNHYDVKTTHGIPVEITAPKVEESTLPCVRSKAALTPQDYLEKITGNVFFLKMNDPVAETEAILEEYWPEECIWSYPLDEIDHLVKKGQPVVLVDVSTMATFGENAVTTPAYRWFVVPNDFEYIEGGGDE